MKLIVGLGNPGREYQNTRHNAGFMVIDRLAEKHAAGMVPKARFQSLTLDCQIGGEKALLMKPTTYMNRSGQAVAEAVRFFKVDPWSDVLVLVDDVALPCGQIRLRESGGAGGHNGLGDIEQKLGGSGYARLRIGIDQPGIVPQVDYVLGRFTEEQASALKPALEQAAEAAEVWATQGAIAAMNRFNTREKAGKQTSVGANAGGKQTRQNTNDPAPRDAAHGAQSSENEGFST